MSRLSFHTAASRADAALYTVVVNPLCPCCDSPVTVTVDGDQIDHIPDCADPEDTCYGASRIARITETACAMAQGERDSYARHLREGDYDRD